MSSRIGCVRFRRGRWELDFRDALGRRHQESCTDLRKDETRQKREAEARLYKRLEEVNVGTYQPPSEHLTVNEVLDRYLENHVGPAVEPETLKEYTQLAALHLRPHVGHLVARTVKKAAAEALRATLLRTEVRMPKRYTKTEPKVSRMLSPRTVGKVLQLLSSAYRYAVNNDWVIRNPMDGLRRPKQRTSADHAQAGALTFSELQSLFEKADDQWRLLLKFAAFTGMREAEICGLSWDDVNWADRTVFVRQTWRHGRMKAPKTEHSLRRVEFPAMLELELKAWRLACPKGEHNLVFPTQAGTPHNPANLLHRGLYPALRRAGLRRVRFHDLRHSFASLALANGENLGAVSAALGHADSSITLKVYRHLMPGEGKGMSDRLADKVFAAAPPSGGKVVEK